MNEPRVSIIIPVKNEGKLLKSCLESIAGLDYPQEKIEVIIADGLSTDDTAEVARSFGASVVINRKQTVAPGRNLAFAASTGDLIAFTDADCIVDSKWIRNALKYFGDESIGCVGGPNLTPQDENSFGKAVGFVFNQWIFAAGSIHARELGESRAVKSIPGCNAIYRKQAIEKVMPIDESLLTCDDTELNYRLGDNGYTLLYTPDVYVWHYRRPDPKRLWKQIYRYAIGRLQVGKRDRRMINPVHIIVGIGMPLLLVVLLVAPLVFLYALLAGLVFLAGYALYSLIMTRSLKTSLQVPLVIVILFFAWSTGFMRELLLPLGAVEGK